MVETKTLKELANMHLYKNYPLNNKFVHINEHKKAVRKAKEEVINSLEDIDNEMRKTNELWRLPTDLILETAIDRIREIHLSHKK